MTSSNRVYQIQVSDNGTTVVGSFWRAISHIAAFSTPDENERRHWGEMSGSYAQKVRYSIETMYDSLCIIEHNPDASPGRDTDMFWLDLVNDFDPSYELQKAIYQINETPDDAEDIAARLDVTIRNGIKSERDGDDEAALERFQKIELLMESETVIPQDGSATSALDRIPEIIMQRFNSHLEQLRARSPAF